MVKICPHKLRNGLPCDDTCVYRGMYTDKKSGEKYLSCYYSHRRLPEDERVDVDAKSSTTAGNSSQNKEA